ncbi:MAG TPA: hypothetical protein VE523_09470 [Solirubrobacterales bacterium]|jgi:hypothetical protein|nr:hypothetical protein [Solirubrobacterales bacterium]
MGTEAVGSGDSYHEVPPPTVRRLPGLGTMALTRQLSRQVLAHHLLRVGQRRGGAAEGAVDGV